jgi:PilZ domain
MLQYQQRIGSDRRVHQRLEDVRASLVELGGNNSGIVLNISEGGMAILSAEDLDGHALRNLRFQAPEFEHWIETAGEIAWLSDSRKHAGIRFKGLSETARTQLRAGISIATTRVKWAEQANQAGATAERQEHVTDSPASFATADSATRVASESKHVSDQVNTNSLAEEIDEDEGLLHSDARDAALDSRSPAARREIETKEKAILSAESINDGRTQLLDSSDTKPQKTSALVALDARSSPLTLQKSAVAEMPSRNLLPNSGVRQPSDAHEGILNRADISYGKWVALGAIAILASLLAFLVGWLLGDPSRIKLGH